MIIYKFHNLREDGRTVFKGNNGTYLISKEDIIFNSNYWKPDIVEHFQKNPEQLVFLGHTENSLIDGRKLVSGTFTIETMPVYEYKCIGEGGCREDFVTLVETKSCGQCGRKAIPIEEYYKNPRKYAK